MSKIYKVEVGVLLEETSSEYSSYNTVYDKLNAYYDENTLIFVDLEDAKKYTKEYVSKGKDRTYGIISDLGELPENMEVSTSQELIFSEDGISVDLLNAFDSSIMYGVSSIVYSVKKIDGKLIENFIGKTKQDESLKCSKGETDMFNINAFVEKVMKNLKTSNPIRESFKDNGKEYEISVMPIGNVNDLMFKVIISIDGKESRDFAEDETSLIDMLQNSLKECKELVESVEDNDGATHIVHLYPIMGGYYTTPIRVHAEDYDSTEDIIEKAVVKCLENGDYSFTVDTYDLSNQEMDDYLDSDVYLYVDLTPYGFGTYFIKTENLRVEELD